MLTCHIHISQRWVCCCTFDINHRTDHSMRLSVPLHVEPVTSRFRLNQPTQRSFIGNVLVWTAALGAVGAVAFGYEPRTSRWPQYPGLSLQDTLDRLQSDVEALKHNLSSSAQFNQRYTDQLQFMDSENAQLRQGLITFLQKFATFEERTLEMNQGLGTLTTRLQSVQSEVSQLATKASTRLGAVERANDVWRRNFKTVNRALKVLKRKVKFRVPRSRGS